MQYRVHARNTAMAYHLIYVLQSSILALASVHGVGAVQFDVKNNALKYPGGIRFARGIGVEYAKQTMATTTKFIWNMFQQYDAKYRKNHDLVSMVIHEYKGSEAFVNVNTNTINVSAVYLQLCCQNGDLKREFTVLVYHEMTHIWQWFGPAGQVPSGLIEGIADYTVLKAGYNGSGYAMPGVGDRWDQGYAVTARFLEYCEGIRPGFVAALNRMMRVSYSVEFFVKLLGKPVDQLWREYKAKYGGRSSNVTDQDSSEREEREYKDRLIWDLIE